jgi:hypothetical protein
MRALSIVLLSGLLAAACDAGATLESSFAAGDCDANRRVWAVYIDSLHVPRTYMKGDKEKAWDGAVDGDNAADLRLILSGDLDIINAPEVESDTIDARFREPVARYEPAEEDEPSATFKIRVRDYDISINRDDLIGDVELDISKLGAGCSDAAVEGEYVVALPESGSVLHTFELTPPSGKAYPAGDPATVSLRLEGYDTPAWAFEPGNQDRDTALGQNGTFLMATATTLYASHVQTPYEAAVLSVATPVNENEFAAIAVDMNQQGAFIVAGTERALIGEIDSAGQPQVTADFTWAPGRYHARFADVAVSLNDSGTFVIAGGERAVVGHVDAPRSLEVIEGWFVPANGYVPRDRQYKRDDTDVYNVPVSVAVNNAGNFVLAGGMRAASGHVDQPQSLTELPWDYDLPNTQERQAAPGIDIDATGRYLIAAPLLAVTGNVNAPTESRRLDWRVTTNTTYELAQEGRFEEDVYLSPCEVALAAGGSFVIACEDRIAHGNLDSDGEMDDLMAPQGSYEIRADLDDAGNIVMASQSGLAVLAP